MEGDRGWNVITVNPRILGGKPIIEGTRISVEFILELLASDVSGEDISGGLSTLEPGRHSRLPEICRALLQKRGVSRGKTDNMKLHQVRILADENFSSK